MSAKPMDAWAKSHADQRPERPRTASLPGPKVAMLDLSQTVEVRVKCGEHFVATTPEHLIECVAWLLTNVDIDAIVTKYGIEVDG